MLENKSLILSNVSFEKYNTGYVYVLFKKKVDKSSVVYVFL